MVRTAYAAVHAHTATTRRRVRIVHAANRISNNQLSATSRPGGSAHGVAGCQRSQRHGPPSRAGTSPSDSARLHRDPGCSGAESPRGRWITSRKPADHTSNTAPAAVHSAAPRRAVSRTDPPETWAASTATAKATGSTTTDFSKNSNATANTTAPDTAYPRRPVRTSRTASALTQASAICNGSAFTAAAHQANAGTVNGTNR